MLGTERAPGACVRSCVVPTVPGRLVLFGSGEASPTARGAFDWLFQRLPSHARLAILETPAGFQPNSAGVAGQIAGSLAQRLRNHGAEITVVAARKRGTPFSPDDQLLADQVLMAECIFAGPGSPTYAVRELRSTLVWDAVRARFAQGGALVFASAAVLAIGTHTLPVYEIYKAGFDLGWEPGLDLLGPIGLELAIVPHWNNREGGARVDTSRCYMGQERFARLRAMLPPSATVLGIDEHTALVLEPGEGTGVVMGQGGVTVDRAGETRRFERGRSMPIEVLGEVDWGAFSGELPESVRERSRQLEAQRQPGGGDPGMPEVMALVQLREAARERHDWGTADALRSEIAARGYIVQDTQAGPRVLPLLAHPG